MRLYLSSYHLGFRTDALRRPSETGRAGVILNALDVKGSSRDGNLGHEVAGLEALGYRCEELDLRDYFEVPASLSARLRGLDMVWVVGGNSFVLARAMGLARFSQALPTGAARDFTYAGYSAGASETERSSSSTTQA